MQKSNLYSSAIFILLGLFFINPSLKLGLTSPITEGVPGAGFFPFVMAIGIIILGLFISIETIITMKKGLIAKEATKLNQDNFKNTLVIILTLVIYLLMWRLTNYYISTLIVSLFLNWYFKRTIIFNLVFSIGFTSVVYFVFNLGLKIQFVI